MQFIARLISTTIIAGLACLVMIPMTPYVPTEWRYCIWGFSVFGGMTIGYYLEMFHKKAKELNNESQGS